MTKLIKFCLQLLAGQKRQIRVNMHIVSEIEMLRALNSRLMTDIMRVEKQQEDIQKHVIAQIQETNDLRKHFVYLQDKLIETRQWQINHERSTWKN